MNYAAMRYVAETCTAEGAGRALLWAISYRANKHTGECWESLRKLAAAAGISYATAKRAKAELLERGELELVLTSAGRHRATHLRIHVPGLTVSHRDESLQGSNDPAPGLNAPPVQGSNGDPSIRQEGKNVEGGRRSSAAASTAAAEPTADALGSSSASGNGVPPDATAAIAALKASLRPPPPATAPTIPECDPDPRAECDPPDVANPAPTRAGTPHQDMAREPIDRRRRTARRGRRGREPPAVCTRSRTTSRSPPWPTTSGAAPSPAVLGVCSASQTSCQPTNMAIRRKHAAPHSRSSRPCEPEGTDPEAVSPLRRPRQGDPMPPDLPSDQGAPHVRTPTG